MGATFVLSPIENTPQTYVVLSKCMMHFRSSFTRDLTCSVCCLSGEPDTFNL